MQSVAGKAKPKKRQARSVPLGKSNLSACNGGAFPFPAAGKAHSSQDPAGYALGVQGGGWAEGGEEAEAEAVPSLRFLTRHKRTEHPRHVKPLPHPSPPLTGPCRSAYHAVTSTFKAEMYFIWQRSD